MAVPVTIQQLKDKINEEIIPNNNRDVDAIKVHDILIGTANLLGSVSGSFTTSGTTGTSGTNNTSGIDGTSGTSGISGSSGISGTSGTNGLSGTNGTSGISLPNGLNGTSGVSHTSGINGGSGTSGLNGTSGTSDTSGTGGTAGSSGTSGVTDGTSGTSGTSPDLSGVLISSSFHNYTGSIFFTDNSKDIDFSGSGKLDNPLSASLNLSLTANQGLLKYPDGWYYPNLVKNGVILGGIVSWITGFTYNVSPAVYYINSVLYNSPSTNIILSGSDPTNSRFDSVLVNNSGSVVVIQGTPSVDPQIPNGNSSYQLPLTSILVEAGSSQPTTAQLYVYRENTDWSGSRSTVRINLSSSVLPYSGSNIEATNTQAGDFFVYTNPSGSIDVVSNGQNTFLFNISPKPVAPFFSATAGVSIQFYSASVTRGQPVNLFNNTFGLSALSSIYQRIVIPLANFGIIAGDLINRVRFTTIGGTLNGYHIDDIQFQGASVPIVSQLTLNVASTDSIILSGSGTVDNPLTGEIYVNTHSTEYLTISGSGSFNTFSPLIINTPSLSQNPNSRNFITRLSDFNNVFFLRTLLLSVKQHKTYQIYKMPDGNLNDNLEPYTLSGDLTSSIFTKSFKYDRIEVSGSSTPNVNSYFNINKLFIGGEYRIHLKVKVETTSSGNPIIGFRGITPPSSVSAGSSPTAYLDAFMPQVYMYLNLSGSNISHGFNDATTSWDGIAEQNNISGSITPGDILDMYYEVAERQYEDLKVIISDNTGRMSQKTLLYDQRIHGMFGYRGIVMSGGTFTILDYSIESLARYKPDVALWGDSHTTGATVVYGNTIRYYLETSYGIKTAIFGSSATTTKATLSTVWEVLKAKPTYVFISNYINGPFWQQFSSSDAYRSIYLQDLNRQTNIIRQAGIKIIWFAPLPTTTIPVVNITPATLQAYYNFLTGSFPQDRIVTIDQGNSFYDSTGYHYNGTSNSIIAGSINEIVNP